MSRSVKVLLSAAQTGRRVRDLVFLTAAVAAAGLALAGCGTTPQLADEPATSAGTSASPTAKASDSRSPVARAGGLCKLLSYGLVAEATKVDFDHAAAGKRACALQVYGHAYPDLTLAATGTEVKAKDFVDVFAPDGAEEVSKLGEAAFSATAPAKRKAGPAAEVGWLAGGKFYVLRYTFERGAVKGQATQMSTNLVKLAKRIKTA